MAVVGLASTLLVASSLTPAHAEETLDTLRATDAELTKAIDDLDAQVKRQQAEVDAATQSVAAADQAVAQQNIDMDATASRIESLRSAAAQRAVAQYMRPQADGIADVLAAEGMADASRRSAILEEVNGQGRDAIEELKSARTQLEEARTANLAARTVADQRRATGQQKLDQLNVTLGEKKRVDQDLQDRIATAAAEDEASAAYASGSSASGGRANRSGGISDDSRISASGMVLPSLGPIRSPYGYRWGRLHAGIDFGAKNGDPIYAAKAGTVESGGWDSGGYGNLTKIDHGNGVVTWYAHQSRIVVSPGQTVNAGEIIGYAGYTGSVVPQGPGGAHLHFEVHIGGTALDPANYLP